MKKHMIIQIVLTLFVSLTISAQNQLNENIVKSKLSSIFDNCKEQNYSAVAPDLLFSDNKENRAYNFLDNKEARAVKRMTKKIKAYLDLSDSYEYESISFGKFEDMDSADLKVNFRSGDQELTINFIFVKISDKVLLAKFK